jgi:fused signal recognition particle receptor|tara:strand:- start:644 stop:1558 length:915 start_codon:yes stop_codon:yes gene_type:complete
MSIFEKFKLGLSKSSKNLSSGLNNFIFKKKIDKSILNELEDFLIQSDVGVEAAKELTEKFSKNTVNQKDSEKNEIIKIFSSYISEILKPLEKNLENIKKNKPSVILIAGVNGVGKTTTIGKLGKILGQNNGKVVLGAADTFRAAAVTQLEVWAKKINADIIKSEEGADPASVAYKALEYAKKNNSDFLIIDTAGRLQNKKNLMDEFKKIIKVTKKIDANSPHEIFLILDATTGQSAINQVEEFQKIAPLTGIIMTKLDGTAKGGILLAIGKKFKLPIVALGMGEKEDDLQMFNSQHFAKAIMND